MRAQDKRTAAIAALALFSSVLVGIFFATSKAQAQTVTNCTNIGILQNGSFERPVSGLTIDSSGGTYPATPAQNATPPQFGGIYRQLSNGYYNHTDATADTSTYRTFVLPGRPNDERMYWYTTESDNGMEITTGGAGYGGVTASAGSQFVELNANVNAGIFQDLATVPGQVMRWSLKHASRSGSAETMQVSIGNPTNSIATVMSSTPANGDGNDTDETTRSATRSNSARAGLTVQSATKVGTNTPTTTISDSSSSWSTWYGSYTDTNTTNSTTRLFFEATGASQGGSGNELDEIIFSPVAACPITRVLNSPTATATINPFDTSTSSFAIVPNEVGSSESITALTRVSGSGTATLNSGNMTFQYSPGGSGTSIFNYTLTYTANGLTSTSDGTMKITARDPYGGANCSPGAVDTTTSGTVNGSPTYIVKFSAPTQANTDADTDHRSGSCTWTVPEGVYAVDYLVVAGGGGAAGGGGGAGGVVTSWSTYLATDTSTSGLRTTATNGLAVTPGNAISIQVGGGGKPGWGGTLRPCGTTQVNNQPTRTASNGADSKFGSITAVGGGAGGSYWKGTLTVANGCNSGTHGSGANGGSGGGAPADGSSSQVTSSSNSTVVGARTFGNGGGSSTATSYAGGAGGGGAGTNAVVTNVNNPAIAAGGNGGIGGSNRATNTGGVNGAVITQSAQVSGNNVGTGISNGNANGAGGHGGRGVASNIASLNGTLFAEYACGGGAGTNDNNNLAVPAMAGQPGCPSAGRGSSYGVLNSPDSGTSKFDGTPVPTEGFGGGGGGTDPEDNLAGSGGSGVVYIRYIISDVNCPNSSNNTAIVGPIACPYPITITAGAAIQISYNLTYGDESNGYFSYPGANTDTATVNTTIANGTDTVTSTPANGGRTFTFRLNNTNSALVGATYPLQYTIFSGSSSSTSYVLLTIADPNQHTPVRIGIDPRSTSIKLPPIRIGNPTDTQVCFTPRVDSTNNGYGNTPSIVRLDNSANETTVASTVAGRLIVQGTNSALQIGMSSIQINKNASDRFLLPSIHSRFIDVNVSNTAAGGNGSCSFGTSSVLEIYPLGMSLTQGQDIVLKPTP